MNLSREDVRPLDSRHPLQAAFLVVCLQNGIALCAGVVTSNAVAQNLEGWQLRVWGAILIIGSALGLLGMFWRGERLDGLLWERLGLFILGLGMLVLAGTIFATVGLKGLFVAEITAVLGAGFLKQSWRIHKAIERIRGKLRNIAEDNDGG